MFNTTISGGIALSRRTLQKKLTPSGLILDICAISYAENHARCGCVGITRWIPIAEVKGKVGLWICSWWIAIHSLTSQSQRNRCCRVCVTLIFCREFSVQYERTDPECCVKEIWHGKA